MQPVLVNIAWFGRFAVFAGSQLVAISVAKQQD
jgi:hypothetical protein